MSSSKYEKVRYISQGSYGVVCEFFEKETGKKVAIKTNHHKKEQKEQTEGTEEVNISDGSDFYAELYYSNLFEHPNIVKFEDYFITTGENISYNLVMELAKTDLGSFLSKDKLSAETKKDIIFSIGKALDYIHNLGFSHSDIKPNNVLVFGEEKLIFKLTDFGFTRPKENVFSPYISQTECYRAPEQICQHIEEKSKIEEYFPSYSNFFKQNFTRNNDILSEYWAFGIFCLDVLYNINNITYRREISDIFYFNMIEKISKNIDNSLITVIDIFGDINIEEEKVMLINVCKYLLRINQNERNLKQFLLINYGGNRPICSKSNFGKLPPDNKYNVDIEKIDLNWIIKIIRYFDLVMIHSCNLMDIIFQYSHLIEAEKYKLFVLAVIWMLDRIYVMRIYDVFMIGYIKRKTKYTIEDFEQMIFHIHEQRIFYNYESLYFQLNDFNHCITGFIEMVYNTERYLSFGTPSKAATFIVNSKKCYKVCNKTNKFVKIVKHSKNRYSAIDLSRSKDPIFDFNIPI